MRTSTKRRAVAVASVVALVAAGAVAWRGMMGTEHLEVTEPTAAEAQSVAETRVFFGHQSVGANVLSGLADLPALAGTALQIVESSSAGSYAPGTVVHAYLGTNGDPQSKLDAFAQIMDAGMAESVDVALLKFCYVDVTAGTDVRGLVTAYLDEIGELQARHPSVTFLYATVPLMTSRDVKATIKSWLGRDAGGGPEDNVARQEFNATLREHVAGTGLLFDIAAVEAGGIGEGRLRLQDGHDYFVLHDSFAADPGHLNEVGSEAAAAELVRTIAAARADS